MMSILHRAGVAGTSLLMGASLLFLGSCGYKDHPVPPDTVVPQAIEDLRYQTDEKGVTLAWSYPMETIRGTEIEDLSSFELYRAEVPLKDYCATCPIPFADPVEQPGGLTTEDGKARTAMFTMAGLKPGYKYFFKVRSRTSWFAQSADSNIVTFIWQEPAMAPEGLTATVGNKQITLSWQPVTTLRDGNPVSGPLQYQIMRSSAGKKTEKIGLVERGTTFVDRNVALKEKYTYQVQTQLLVGKEVVAGGMSTVSALSVDKTPPEPPTGVTAIDTDMGTKVLWEKSGTEDLGGYRVYRRAADAKEAVMVGEVEPVYTLYVDTEREKGQRYYYSVTAFDQGSPANESQRSAEATTRH
ncbi:MAG: hypothetical protein F9K32_00520 [Desulfobulbaceae bacterium]|nr:MAG: hypothetical protein F9K32_00520 [Desulfobulbaceae bacterium]